MNEKEETIIGKVITVNWCVGNSTTSIIPLGDRDSKGNYLRAVRLQTLFKNYDNQIVEVTIKVLPELKGNL